MGVDEEDGYTSIGWKNKAGKIRGYELDQNTDGNNPNFKVMSVTTTRQSYDQDAFYYSWYSAFLYDHEATAWGEAPVFSTDGSAPYHDRPTDAGCSGSGSIHCVTADPGTISPADEPTWNDSVVTRTTSTGTITVDTVARTGSFQ